MTRAFLVGTVIDGTGAPPREWCTVVTEGGRITAYGVRDEVEVPHGAEVVEAPDATLIPGLIDLACASSREARR